jgi:hypothetical protein
MTPAGFPHSDIPGSQLGCQLPRAYRRLLRPSSALDAKASTMCPSQLATTNTTPHPPTITGRHSTPAARKENRPRVVDGSTLQRCSRPLSRSQTTTPHRPHPKTPPKEGSGQELEPPAHADASEPQQCAPTHHPHPPCTTQDRQKRRARKTIDGSTSEHHHAPLHASRPQTGQAVVGVNAP